MVAGAEQHCLMEGLAVACIVASVVATSFLRGRPKAASASAEQAGSMSVEPPMQV